MTQTKPAALPGETEREYAWRCYPVDAKDILEERESPQTKCGQPLCRADVWWGVTAANGRRTCFDIKPNGERTGTNHWRTCRDRPKREPMPQAPKARKPATSRVSPERIAELRARARQQIGLEP